MKNLFIIPKGLSEGVINSQILQLVLNLNRYNQSINKIAIHNSDKDKLNERNEVYCSLFFYLFKKTDVDYLYTRSVFDFLKAYIVKKIFYKKYKILYDFRGIVNEESYLRNKSLKRKKLLFLIEKFVYKKADKIHTVSNNLKYYLEENFGKKNIHVVPCAINHNIKKEKYHNDNIKFLYLGSIAVWQKFEETIKIYGLVEKSIKNSHLTIITMHKNKALEIVEKYNIINYKIKSISHNEVLRELREYDFGFLLRDDNIVNNTASPIKFLEYLSNGVLPIMSKNIGDYSSLVEENKIGIILEKEQEIDINEIYSFLDNEKSFKKMKNITDQYLWSTLLRNYFRS